MTAPAVEQLALPCVHHWRIEEAHGTPKVRGECLNCGTTRLYDVAEPWKDAKEAFKLNRPAPPKHRRTEPRGPAPLISEPCPSCGRCFSSAWHQMRHTMNCGTYICPSCGGEKRGGLRAKFCKACTYAQRRTG